MNDDKSIELAKEAIKESFQAAKEFAGKLINPGLQEGGGIIQDTVKFWRFKNQVNILLKAKKFLEEKGMNPKMVLPKTLVPLLENGSLEEDDEMQDRWASLLATAADPNSRINVRPSFAEILKELSPIEALILDKIYELVVGLPIPKEDRIGRGAAGISLKQFFALSDDEFEISIDNLYRLRLCSPPSIGLDFVDHKEHKFQLQMKEIICLTDFGFAFVTACRYGK